MQTLRLVASDLWAFVRSEFRGETLAEDTAQSVDSHISAVTSPAVVSPVSTSTSRIQTNGNPADIRHDTLTTGQDVFVLYPDTPCYLRPALVRDTMLGTFAYAATVKVVATQEQWVRIANNDLEGWTERAHLTAKQSDVSPTFASGVVYDADDLETLKLRTWIKDEFGLASLHVPLLNCEYVWYQMLVHRTVFAWPPLRPRTPGRWSEILRPEPSVLISVVPMTGSIIEYTDEQRVAQLWYVEAVTPEEAITVSGFLGNDIGEYQVKTMTKDEWTKLQPRFIIKK